MAANPGLTADGKKILKALADSGEPLAGKQIAGASGLDSKLVSATVKKLKAQGLVDSPVRCKYGLTSDGKASI